MSSRARRHLAAFSIVAALCGLVVPGPAHAGNDSPKVKLLSSGRGAKTALRFTPAVGQKSTVTMIMEIEIGMTMGAMQLPSTKAPVTELDMEIEVTKVDPRGDIRYEFEYTATRIVSNGGADAAAVAQMKSSLAGLKGMKGYAVVDTTGRTKEADFATTKKLDPQLEQLLQSIRQSMNQMSVPFPVEKVGVGAKWSVKTHLDKLSFPIDQVATYRLRSLKGSRGTLEVTIEQRAAGSRMNLPNLPPGTTARILSLKSKGTGQVEFDLSQLTPVASTVSLTSLTKTEISSQGQSQVMEMDMKMKVDLGTR